MYDILLEEEEEEEEQSDDKECECGSINLD
jgi:hypothetical protein